MNLLFTGPAPWVNSGYGKPLRYLLPRLARAGHNVAVACYYGMSGSVIDVPFDGESVRLYPPVADPYLHDVIEHHAHDFNADAVISLQDVWKLEDWDDMEFLWLPWLTVDCEPVSDPVKQSLGSCQTPLCYSQWGTNLLVEAGWSGARYVPLGVDTDLYKPMNRREARRKCGLPEDGFVAGMVAKNLSTPSRKSIPEVLLAWQKWRKYGGEGWLYIHTSVGAIKQGIRLDWLLESLNMDWCTLGDDHSNSHVIFPHQYKYHVGGYGDEELAMLYNSFNVLLSPSMAEGFGIPILEAQACGVPVVTTDFSSMSELTFSGLSLDPLQRFYEPQGGWRAVVGVNDIARAFDVFAMSDSDMWRGEAVRGAAEFSWNTTVSRYWLPLLERLQ